MTKLEIRTMRHRIAALTAELSDPTCLRFPLAARRVQAELDRVTATLRGAA